MELFYIVLFVIDITKFLYHIAADSEQLNVN